MGGGVGAHLLLLAAVRERAVRVRPPLDGAQLRSDRYPSRADQGPLRPRAKRLQLCASAIPTIPAYRCCWCSALRRRPLGCCAGGGSTLFDGGLYHLYAAQMRGSGMVEWDTRSECIHVSAHATATASPGFQATHRPISGSGRGPTAD